MKKIVIIIFIILILVTGILVVKNNEKDPIEIVNKELFVEVEENLSDRVIWQYELFDVDGVVELTEEIDDSNCQDMENCITKKTYKIVSKKEGIARLTLRQFDVDYKIVGFRSYTIKVDSNLNISETHVQEEDKIRLNEKTWIVPEKNIYFNDTDYVSINEKIIFPPAGEGMTISFDFLIPYTISVDGIEYNGTFKMDDNGNSSDDENPKYNFEITDLYDEGALQVLIKQK